MTDGERVRRFAAVMVAVAALLPASARAGVTLHFSGTARTEKDAAGALADAVAFAKARGWGFEQRDGAVVLRPHAWCEPVELAFAGRALSRNWVKTQFAGPETHVAVVELFRTLRPRFEDLSIDDEGEYWESSDRERLLERMQADGLMMVRLEQQKPGTKGPYVAAGRIIDVAFAFDPAMAPQFAAELEAAGAKLLDAPLVPARPWIPDVKRLPATAPDGWRRFEAPRERFTVSFPAAPETVTGGDGIGYHAASNDAVFLVHAGAPAIGDDASQVLADLAPSFANEFVGRIISDVRSTRNGASERTLVVVAGGTVLHHRVVVLGNRSWVLTAGARGGARPADEDVQTFFDSFRPVEE